VGFPPGGAGNHGDMGHEDQNTGQGQPERLRTIEERLDQLDRRIDELTGRIDERAWRNRGKRALHVTKSQTPRSPAGGTGPTG